MVNEHRLTPFWAPTQLAQHPGTALRCGDVAISYRELARRVAQRVADLGRIRRLVAIEAGNDPEPLITYLACLAGGHVALLVASSGTSRDIECTYQPDSVMRRDYEGNWQLQTIRDQPLGGLSADLAVLLSTSGSTGSPKLVRLSMENLASNAGAISDFLTLTDHDVAATVLPWSYCYGLSVINTHVLSGGTLVLTDLSLADPCFWQLAQSTGVTNLSGVPYSFELLDQAGFDPQQLPSLRLLTQAGGRLAPELVTQFASLCARNQCDFFVMYGQSEATARIAYLDPSEASRHPDCIGRVIPGGSLKLEQDEELPNGQGELVYSGPNVMLGYAETRSDLARESMPPVLHTGDIAEITSNGLYRIVGRKSRFAKPFGLRIDLQRLEDRINEASGGVVCVEQPGGIGILVSNAASRRDDIIHRAATNTGLPQSAFSVAYVDELPRLTSDKIDYATAAATCAATPIAPADPLTPNANVATILSRVLGVPDVAPQDSFVSLGGDSLSYVAASAALQKRLGDLPPGWQRMSVQQLTAQLPEFADTAAPRRRSWIRMDTGIVLRAVAIVLIVGSHIGVFDVRGGAHLLLALAGFGVARFVLADPQRRVRTRRILRTTTRIVTISLLWLVPLTVLSSEYGPSVLFANNLFGPAGEAPEWRYWFLETLVYLMIGVALLLRVPILDRWEHRWPSAFPIALTGLGAVVALVTAAPSGPASMYTPAVGLWLFAAGWAVERAPNLHCRLAIIIGVLAVGTGFFNRPDRVGVVVVGLVLVASFSSVRVPRLLAPVMTALAGASLVIYLTHYQIYPLLGEQRWAALGISLLAGVGVWLMMAWLRKHSCALIPALRKSIATLIPTSPTSLEVPRPTASAQPAAMS